LTGVPSANRQASGGRDAQPGSSAGNRGVVCINSTTSVSADVLSDWKKKAVAAQVLEERANDDWINAATLMVFCSIAV